MKPVLTDKQVDDLRWLRAAGKSFAEIGKAMNVSTATAFNYAHDITTGRAK